MPLPAGILPARLSIVMVVRFLFVSRMIMVMRSWRIGIMMVVVAVLPAVVAMAMTMFKGVVMTVLMVMRVAVFLIAVSVRMFVIMLVLMGMGMAVGVFSCGHDRFSLSWRIRKKSSPRWKPGSREYLTHWKYLIPAFAGMTKNEEFRLFTSPSNVGVLSLLT
jgi:hypothetical protein